MSLILNGKKIIPIINGKRTFGIMNGKMVWGLRPFLVTPNTLSFQGTDSGSSVAKTATISNGTTPYSFDSSLSVVPSWLSVSLEANGLITAYPLSTNSGEERSVVLTYRDSTWDPYYTAQITVKQKKGGFKWGIVGLNTIEIIDIQG